LELLDTYLTKYGTDGKRRLALAVGRGEQMIDRYRKRQAVPPSNVAFRIALACGLEEAEALALAKECPAEKVRETA
jgi:hypothetical protein